MCRDKEKKKKKTRYVIKYSIFLELCGKEMTFLAILT